MPTAPTARERLERIASDAEARGPQCNDTTLAVSIALRALDALEQLEPWELSSNGGGRVRDALFDINALASREGT